MWLVATILDSAEGGHFHHHENFYGTALVVLMPDERKHVSSKGQTDVFLVLTSKQNGSHM